MNGSSPPARLTFVAPGLDLAEAIGQLGGTDGWVHGAGHVEEVELRVAAEGADALTLLRGRFNLLSLAGPRGGPFAVTLARLGDTGLQVVGGELVRARSAGVTVIVQPAIRDVAVAATKMPDSPATWARAAAASAAAIAHENEEHVEEFTPEAGDRVQHFAFGVCEVLTSDGDRLRIRDVDGPRRVREVSLSMLRVTGPTVSDGKRLFQLERRVPV
ncbi:MAG TPA: hypothetical protein VK540_02925 [Polyangiaceae bacterium]|nr:hypothetical protein [Polyangiaceae bacterium]